MDGLQSVSSEQLLAEEAQAVAAQPERVAALHAEAELGEYRGVLERLKAREGAFNIRGVAAFSHDEQRWWNL